MAMGMTGVRRRNKADIGQLRSNRSIARQKKLFEAAKNLAFAGEGRRPGWRMKEARRKSQIGALLRWPDGQITNFMSSPSRKNILVFRRPKSPL